MSEIIIRPAVAADTALILKFVKDLAVYEKAEHEVAASEEDIMGSLFGIDSTAEALICTVDGKPAGYAVYFYNYSTWLGRKGLYLEDLYVTPESRGKGAGKALLQYLAKTAVSEKCGRFEWSVLDWNTPAIEFYESIGALPQTEWVAYRLTGESLMKFAENDY